MLNKLQIKQPYHWLLGLLIISLVIFKIEALYLPFYWDEAWVYMPAIRTMAEQGPSVMPASIDPNLYTGHPLLFYFLSSTWINLFGYSLPIAHSFPLLLSVLLLISVYYVSYSWSNSYFTAFTAALLVFIQPIFIAQSSFLLVEIWLALLFVWSFWFYFQRKYIAFIITLVLALWSKESAYCLLPAFGITAIAELYLKRISTKDFFKIALYIVISFLVGFSFFIIQKIKLGWFFFPRHANWIVLDQFYKIDGAFIVLFLSQGKNIICLATLVIFIIAYTFYKFRLSKDQLIILFSILVFCIGFMLFASINFFSSRYLFGAIPLLMIACSFIISSIRKPFYALTVLLLLFGFGLTNINNSIKGNRYSDVELNYTRVLKTQLKLIDYLEKNKLDGKIYATFLMYSNLTVPKSGFVEKPFTNVVDDIADSSAVYFIKSPNEEQSELNKMIEEKRIHLIQQFEDHQIKIELYKK